ncbi:MAG TPA: DUF2934 domain-containing protein [Pirellulales bacterium]|nr:DUF2934 domain-containing protein [Pirellulales bacterium]
MKAKEMNPVEARQAGRSLGRMAPQIVARRAYHIWQSHGRPSGTATTDWLQAEAELQAAGLLRRGRCEKRCGPRGT